MPTPPRSFKRWAEGGGTARISTRIKMNNQVFDETRTAQSRGRSACGAAVMAAAALMAITGCSSRTDNRPGASSAPATNVTLTAAQRQNIRFFVVAPSKFRKTIEAAGTVDFDNDQATS